MAKNPKLLAILVFEKEEAYREKQTDQKKTATQTERLCGLYIVQFRKKKRESAKKYITTHQCQLTH